MQKVYILKGLPGSGKSTWAKEELKKDKNLRRVNRDELRDMLWGSRYEWSGEKERSVTTAQRDTIVELLYSGYSVVIDDTNLNPKTVNNIKNWIKEICEDERIEIIEKFFDVKLKECIKRDLRREHSVGKDVIMEMYNKYLRPKYKYTPTTDERAIVVDIDGTAAIMHNRSPFEWDKVDQDLPNEPVRTLVKAMMHTHKIIFLSGRDGSCFEKTKEWINKHYDFLEGVFDLGMRAPNDTRSDDVVKHELFENVVACDGLIIDFILDDRDQVVDMWRLSYGLPCFQVNYGNF